jgi:hypothetical protein
MPSDIIPSIFGVVPVGVRAKQHPGKCANRLPFSLLQNQWDPLWDDDDDEGMLLKVLY